MLRRRAGFDGRPNKGILVGNGFSAVATEMEEVFLKTGARMLGACAR
jgi:hypothetical protein